MNKTIRDTSMWFDNDYKGTNYDRKLAKLLAPGCYDTNF